MKLQDVILRAIAKKITWLDAAEIAGLSVTTIARMRQKYEEFGYDGLYEQQHRKRHIHRVPLPTAEKVLALYQQSYQGMSVRQFHQKLRGSHSIRLSSSWLRQALQGAGLIAVPPKPPAPPRATKIALSVRRRIHFVRAVTAQKGRPLGDPGERPAFTGGAGFVTSTGRRVGASERARATATRRVKIG